MPISAVKSGRQLDQEDLLSVRELTIFYQIIRAQKAQGFWTADALRTIIFAQGAQEGLTPEVWATFVILAWLRQTQPERISEWALVAKKAEKWLKRQKVNFQTFSIEFN